MRNREGEKTLFKFRQNSYTIPLQDVETLLDHGINSKAFPGAVAMWGPPNDPHVLFKGLRGSSRDRISVSLDLIYDLASLSKVLVCTSLAMIAYQRGQLDLKQPLSKFSLKFLKDKQWELICPEHLLSHQSALPPWRAFHRLTVEDNDPKKTLLQALESIKIESAPAFETVYSDINFIILGFLLEEIGGASLTQLFNKEIVQVLNLSGLSYRPQSGPLAPTEDGFRWGGPIGNREGGFKGAVPLGRPHDDNAFFLNSVAGHAGLFGNAPSVWALASEWSAALNNKSAIFTKKTMEEFMRPRKTASDLGRPLGFNILSQMKSIKSSILSPDSIGHTGYTGPSLWWDWKNDFIWLLLCNRVHPKADNKAWFPALYQAGPSFF